MKNLLEYLLIHLAQFPEDVVIEEMEDERGMTYLLHVNQEDMGRIIGKNGSVIESIRKIAKVRAVKEGIRAYIKLVDVEEEVGNEANENVEETNDATDENVAALETEADSTETTEEDQSAA
jgi:uncharacterized protein